MRRTSRPGGLDYRGAIKARRMGVVPLDTIIAGDCLAVLRALPGDFVDCCVTSPPYWGLRDYGCAGQLGAERTVDEYVSGLTAVFHEVRRVLRETGTLWLNLGDCYHKGQLAGAPWRVALSLQADGWRLRQDIIWHKPNPMPESVRDRCTRAHEYLFLLTKSKRYYWDKASMEEPATYAGVMRGGSRNRYAQNNASMDRRVYNTRNRRSVWTIKPTVSRGGHFARFPEGLVRPCITAGSPLGGVVLDPFAGSGTTCVVAQESGRHWLGIELNPQYCGLAQGATNRAIKESIGGQPDGPEDSHRAGRQSLLGGGCPPGPPECPGID